ncbi:MAG: hypothetical protein ACD_52C00024G0007 [uncultured bacterium]|uniref:Uncharacterized protein n=1 Tax=Candidatus Woesebacteria bacterium RIFCSPHIGHO2_12_FULL_41_24 TaxID=1802510 RepID=A0A1F8AUM5_9BACT|nr:MAG: hypothetical protein ACD_52C00024G0007 [uncultured bacterium]OGM14358.1 MAG: hypothetical protein A2W15_02305 [Candidatus Woesebacteria bacterium RBG_16_41_13]OGM30780.1 MAG: hypothetical protein A2873_03525 [Candidatus Woesebacteria bacterium RIFCSPHIGHO2_01_FULL_42_80]OGM34203.1 MAG: hypothetical protein A3D84_04295 [Candidatus Woesebacteria bacterium RIFCSPHIGHO2_02_FULL_42_20]OGM55340.1 MAG: hypothetical protein A3E44_03600 [Candidatus Woesebacteria bacterium RIFCSPHIGHO2_12_FULL_41
MRKGVDKRLLRDIRNAISQKALDMKVSTTWFKYLSKSKHGYKFLVNRQKQITTLREILESVSKKQPNLSKGQISEAISKVVNNF